MENILAVSQARNDGLGVTGLLLSYKETIIQVLEGDEEAVRGLYENIARDRRHQNVGICFEGHLPERSFRNWKMAYVSLDQNSAQALCGNLDVASVGELIRAISHPGKILQLFFKQMMLSMARGADERKHVPVSVAQQI